MMLLGIKAPYHPRQIVWLFDDSALSTAGKVVSKLEWEEL